MLKPGGAGYIAFEGLGGVLCLPFADSGGWVCFLPAGTLCYWLTLCHNPSQFLHVSLGIGCPHWTQGPATQSVSHHLDPESSHICKDLVQNEVTL